MTTKICVSKYHIGNRETSLSGFFKDSTRRDGLDKQCKRCRKVMKRRRINKDPELERKKVCDRQLKRYHSDEDYRESQKQLIYKRMPAIAAKRRAQKLKATPPWFEEQEVTLLYEKRSELDETTNIKHNVDHIIPLLHPLVCGLHCLDNLQILTETENKSKHNTFIV